MKSFDIQDDIRDSFTLPAHFYRSQAVFEQSKESIFATTWQYIDDASVIQERGQVHPFIFLEGAFDEPLVFTKDKEGQAHCLSNVCTHRGKIVVEKPGNTRMLSCSYHGRCFRLDGSYKSMPEFEQVNNFPTTDDNLHSIDLKEWLGLLFVSLNPKVSFEEVFKPIQDRIAWMPLDTLYFDAASSKDYYVNAHWALYCDNYLEGFHIPYVHPALDKALDYSQYDYEIFPYCNLQLGIAKEGERVFDIPEHAADFGKNVYAYYFWVFPNLMLNVYPWGISLNIIRPLSHDKTLVRFRTYRFKDAYFNKEEDQLNQTEMEDEAVVESVQLGVQSRYYKHGRFSPTMEKGVHHFHQLIAQFME